MLATLLKRSSHLSVRENVCYCHALDAGNKKIRFLELNLKNLILVNENNSKTTQIAEQH